jgi:hypothetical protein
MSMEVRWVTSDKSIGMGYAMWLMNLFLLNTVKIFL